MGSTTPVFQEVSRGIGRSVTVRGDQKIQFRDTGVYMHSSADGKLTISSDGSGADDIILSGNITANNDLLVSGDLSVSGDLVFGDAATDSLTVNGTIEATVSDIGASGGEANVFSMDSTTLMEAESSYVGINIDTQVSIEQSNNDIVIGGLVSTVDLKEDMSGTGHNVNGIYGSVALNSGITLTDGDFKAGWLKFSTEDGTETIDTDAKAVGLLIESDIQTGTTINGDAVALEINAGDVNWNTGINIEACETAIVTDCQDAALIDASNTTNTKATPAFKFPDDTYMADADGSLGAAAGFVVVDIGGTNYKLQTYALA